MIELSTYQDLYPFAALRREAGVLTVRFHTDHDEW
jgi:hypothetical protein